MENLNIYIRFQKDNEYENGLLCDVVANIFQEKIIRDSSVNRVNWLPRGPAYQIVHGCQNILPIRPGKLLEGRSYLSELLQSSIKGFQFIAYDVVNTTLFKFAFAIYLALHKPVVISAFLLICLWFEQQNVNFNSRTAVFQTTFSNGFSWIKMHEFRYKFHWSLFLGTQLTIFLNWFRLWLGAVQATGYSLNQWWLVYVSICASLSLCLNRRSEISSLPAINSYF